MRRDECYVSDKQRTPLWCINCMFLMTNELILVMIKHCLFSVFSLKIFLKLMLLRFIIFHKDFSSNWYNYFDALRFFYTKYSSSMIRCLGWEHSRKISEQQNDRRMHTSLTERMLGSSNYIVTQSNEANESTRKKREVNKHVVSAN